MISKELIKKIKQIEITSTKLVEEIFSGEYHSNFKGKGMEFDDIREYSYGDDVRNIDWNVTARYNTPYVKQFCEERELNMFLLIDVSKSNNFGLKKEYIAEIGATLSYSANKNNDNVGMILFTDKIEKVIPSKSGKKHSLSIIETILTFEPTGVKTNIKKAIHYFMQIQKKRSIVVIISDFLDEDYEKEVKMISRKHDVVLIKVIDQSEEELPKSCVFRFEDLETKETFIVDNTTKTDVMNKEDLFKSKSMIQLYTHEDYVKPLKLFFRKKVRS